MSHIASSSRDLPVERRVLPFDEAVRARRSWRAFKPTPVPDEIIRQVLEDAQLSPSNCNTQPWNVHLVTGAKRDALSAALHEANDAGDTSADFSWDEQAFKGRYGERRQEHGAVVFGSQGIARDDKEGRRRATNENFSFYGAPHVALLFMPVIGDCVRAAGDLGMYGQTFLLSLAARGIGGVPQTVPGLYSNTVRQALGIPDDLKLLYGISFGYPVDDAPVNSMRVRRDPLEASVTFHR